MSESQFLLGAAVVGGIFAISIVVIACCAVSALQSVRRIETRAADFFAEWQPAAEDTKEAVRHFTEQSGELLARLNALTANAQKQSLHVESALSDLASVAQRNAASVDATIQQVLERINAAAEALDQAVRVPAKQLRALGAGIAAAMRSLSGSRHQDPARISADEEMFL